MTHKLNMCIIYARELHTYMISILDRSSSNIQSNTSKLSEIILLPRKKEFISGEIYSDQDYIFDSDEFASCHCQLGWRISIIKEPYQLEDQPKTMMSQTVTNSIQECYLGNYKYG